MTDKKLAQEEFRLEILKDISSRFKGDGLFANEDTTKWIEFHKYVSEFQMPKNKIPSIDWNKLREKFNEITGKKTRVVITKAKREITARLKEGWKREDIIRAIENSIKDPYHKETNFQYITLEYISRAKTIEKYQEDRFTKPEQGFVAKTEEHDR